MKKYLPVLGILLVFLLLFLLVAEFVEDETQPKTDDTGNTQIGEKGLYVGPANWLRDNLSEEEKQSLIQAFTIQEQDIYTFLQGPKSWAEGLSWSGEWSQFQVDGNPFGGFGCGLCCLANIYNTLSPYEVSPWDLCEYAIEVSEYAPDGRYGAIDWEPMRDTLKNCGIRSKLYRKPKSYQKFQEQMRNARSAIVLICSGDDDTYWQDTPGHYVNIWLYQEEDDTVFLAEPGSPENNRSRVPLRYIYDALKSVSRFQYLLVKGYLEEDNQWKADGIDEIWNNPKSL